MNPTQVSNMFMQMQPDPRAERQNMLTDIAAVEKLGTLKDKQQFRDAFSEAGGDIGKTAEIYAGRGGDPDRVIKLQESAATTDQRKRERQKGKADAGKAMVDLLSGLEDANASTWPVFRQSLAQFAELAGADVSGIPEQFDPAFVEAAKTNLSPLIEQIGGRDFLVTGKKSAPKYTQIDEPKSPTLREIHDPTSPTGTRLVKAEDAIGQPGKMPSKGVTITGYDEQGRPLISVGGSGDMGTAATNQVEKKILSSGDTLAQLTAIRSRFKPEFQTMSTRLGVAWNRMKDRISPQSLTAQERSELDAFTQYRSEATQLFSNTLKELSGAAVTPHEMKRAEAWLPNPGTGMLDGDSPAELEAKIDRFEAFTRKALAKAAFTRRHGLSINDISVDDIPRTMQKRGDELAAEYRRQGVPDDQVRQAVKLRLADEFGLSAY